MKYVRAKNIRSTPVTSTQMLAVAGGAAGDISVAGIKVHDTLIGVARLDRDATAANINLTTLNAEFTVTADDTINNTGGTNTTGDALLVFWQTGTV